MGHKFVDLHEIQMRLSGNERLEGGRHYMFDTNVIMEAVNNPNFWNMLKIRLDLQDGRIHFDSTIRRELEKHGCPVEKLLVMVMSDASAALIGERSERGIAGMAARLERKHSMLHSPDSYILASCIHSKTTLVTRDRGLEQAAREHKVHVINPDKIVTDA